MTILFIIIGTTIAGVGSVFVANLITWRALNKFSDYLLSFAAGTLLATAFLNLIPEAFEISKFTVDLMPWMLVGLLFFFFLDKTKLYHHNHEGDVKYSAKTNLKEERNYKNNIWSILIIGDAIHCFGDGVLIATAFIADLRLGVITTLAVLAHEIPHHVGDLIVVSQSLSSRKDAFIRVSIAGSFAIVGGIFGFIFLEFFNQLLPYFLILASSSFIYVSLADLIPQIQKQASFFETLRQMTWLSSGIFLIAMVSHLGH
tara:strand:- start:155 stop:928 length:774 start_codon:yes stop_codon:yes gene_type:complete